MTYTFGTVKPFSPDEAVHNQAALIPDVVFTAVNLLLSKQALSSSITIRKPDLIDKIRELGGPDAGELCANKWLDVELAYRLQGWEVEYESPDWGSSGVGYYSFRRPTKARPRPADC